MNPLIHNFHFVLNSELKEKIEDLSGILGKSLSNTVIHILEKTLIMMEKYQFVSVESDKIKKYQDVFWNEDIHVFFEKIFYRKIRHLCETMFAFSTAIVVRKLLMLYFEMKEKYDMDDEEFDDFMIIYKNRYVKNYKTFIKKWRKSYLPEQLFSSNYFNLTFNENFTLIGFNYLE